MSLRDQLYPGDVIAALKSIHGPKANMIDFDIVKGTEAVQGFLSCVLRVRATCEVDGEEKEANFVVKKLPLLDIQKKIVENMKIFDQEVAFYRKCLPLMKRRFPDVKVVNCFFAHESGTIVMEDLALQGFENLTKNLSEYREQVMTLAQAKMVMRELAKFHASSQGFDWLKVAPECFLKDIRLEIEGTTAYQNMVGGSLLNSIVPIMECMYKNDPKCIKKYTDWLNDLEGNVWPFLVKFYKANPRYINAVCHGDFWANNFMLRSDPKTQAPLDLRLLDFQVMRYAPVYFDLQLLFYISTKGHFRSVHEESLLRTYFDAFNTFNNVTPDATNFEQFMTGYDETRMSGLLVGMAMCPIAVAFVEDTAPPDDGELSEEHVLKLLGSEENVAEKRARSIKAFREDELFSREMKVMIGELIREMDKNLF
ncbi:uncharacterized protein LOC132200497 [Neocloeon triangulifer]|uniref:uncharacterized protein LOC132200497 n=1 Tax=Neocloeon triangulifer TaxID=2078957 RepID=UPI00286F998A|nr:uncharacterized protein LOC132200497 [Neocloeon triangulifer]